MTSPAATRINPWIIVGLCFSTLAIVLSARQSVAIMTGEWVRTLGWSRTFIGTCQSMVLITIAIVLMPMSCRRIRRITR